MRRRFDGILLGSIELFCLAAERSSFTAAAVAAGVTPAAVSRSVSRLETRLRTRLFMRTTRQIRLTEAGRVYYEQCRQALAQLAEAEQAAGGEQLQPVGVLRMSLPTTYGHYRVLPLLPQFRVRYPGVQIEAHVGNRNINFAEEGYDLAIRARTPEDSGLVARKLEDAAMVVVAAPAYLKRAGTPQTPDELRGHDCIQFELPSSGRCVPWLFRQDGKDIERVTTGGYSCTEDVLAGVTLARAGAGLFQTYRFIVEEDLRRGRLAEVLPTYAGRSRPFSLLYPKARHTPLRVRAFIAYLLEALQSGTPTAARTPA